MSILKTLGYTPYDIGEIFNKRHSSDWIDILMRKKKLDTTLFDNYDAIVLTPAVISFYNELLKEYPNAKFIIEDIGSLTYYKRFKKAQRAFKLVFWLRLFRRTGIFFKMLDISLYTVTKDKKDSISIQLHHNEYIKAIKKDIPAYRLKVLNPSEGWQPLCDFLGHAVPNKKYPAQLNTSEVNRDIRNVIIKSMEGNTIPIILYFITLTSLIVYLMLFY